MARDPDALITPGRVLGDGRVICRIAGGCAACARAEGCAQPVLRRTRRICVDLPTPGTVRGQRVTLGLPAGGLLRAAWLAYGLPLLGLVAGATAGSPVGSEPGSVVGAMLGLLAGIAAGRWLARRNLWRLEPRLRCDR